MIDNIKKLDDEGINDSIVVGFNMFVNSVKNVSNADIIAAIDQQNYDAIALTRTYRITDNPQAPAVRIDESEIIRQKYPYSHEDLKKKIKNGI